MTDYQTGILGLIIILTPPLLLSAYVVFDYLKSSKRKEKKS